MVIDQLQQFLLQPTRNIRKGFNPLLAEGHIKTASLSEKDDGIWEFTEHFVSESKLCRNVAI